MSHLNRGEAERLLESLKVIRDPDNELLATLVSDLERCLDNTGATEFSIRVTYDCI